MWKKISVHWHDEELLYLYNPCFNSTCADEKKRRWLERQTTPILCLFYSCWPDTRILRAWRERKNDEHVPYLK
jgi:hypothetical protein